MAKGKKEKKLTAKELLFCHIYVANDFNATAAAKEAGFSEKSASTLGSRLLQKVKVQEKINQLKGKLTEKSEKKAEDVISELNKIAYAKITDVLKFNESGATFLKSSDEIDPSIAAAIESISFREDNSGVSFKVKMHSKVEALEKLGKYFDLWREKVDLGGDINVNITRKVVTGSAQSGNKGD